MDNTPNNDDSESMLYQPLTKEVHCTYGKDGKTTCKVSKITACRRKRAKGQACVDAPKKAFPDGSSGGMALHALMEALAVHF